MTESKLFTLLLEQPNLYVGHGSVEKIHAFLNGYRETIEMKPDPIYRKYGEWLRNRLRITQDVNWPPIICFFGRGEADSLRFAKEMWAEYLKEIYADEMPGNHEGGEISVTPLGTLKTYELLDEILDRPSLYVGRESVVLVKAFIDGYEFARHRAFNTNGNPLYAGFQDWVAKRFRIDTGHDWASIIAFMGISEARAFELAKELWKEYKAEMKDSPSDS